MDQVARLERGAVTPDKFDYRFLRFESGKAGQAALERLARSDNPAIATAARAAQKVENRNDDPGPAEPERPLAIEVWPAETSMRSAPASLKARAIWTASSPSLPPSTQSVAEMRTDIGRLLGQVFRMAANTSSG